jgi:plasmid stability protein
LYERLRRRAKEQRRSLSSEVITLLTRALEEEEQSPEVTLAAIRSRRFFHPAGVGAPDSTTMLRRDRER